ncbi:putative bifunctional diguanylate cyclase/phosphodiesterase [Bacterioplanoides sp.]|uniref:putative bifunctional diguanylate cyclase/phosphodiesterase n=1 Tax=Bacterioplanoides sp. TaxID=2066072 RepID=UPI003AFF94FE
MIGSSSHSPGYQEHAALFFNNASDAIMLTDTRNIITDVNPAFSQITGYEKDEVLGMPAGFMKSGKHDKAFYQRLWSDLDKNGYWQGEIWDRHKKGHNFPKDVKITAIKDSQGNTRQYVAIFSDISESVNHKIELENLAYFDPLTSYPNRTLLLNTLSDKIHTLQSEPGDQSFTIAFVDIDNFKLYNDTRGHHFGDQLIKNVAARLSDVLTPNDIVGRMSGDEFLIIFDNNKSQQQVIQAVDDLIQANTLPLLIDGSENQIQLSIGLSTYPTDGHNVKDLLSCADIAMYWVKQQGGNSYTSYNNNIGKEFIQKNEIETELPKAIRKEMITPAFQPQLDLKSGKIIGCEALARWEKDDGLFISPVKFIEAAEKLNIVSKISELMVRRSCEAYSQLTNKDDLKLSINISAKDLNNRSFLHCLKDIFEKYNIANHQIELELTEYSLVENFSVAQRQIKRLRKNGFKIAIDDFGTGFSSLNYLKSLEIDTLKLDRSFIQEIDQDDKKGMIILENTIQLAHKLGVKVIAEGVETTEQLNLLKELNCDVIQGYLVSRPLIPETQSDLSRILTAASDDACQSSL